MTTAAILGCAGYTGQETLDRLLGHPGLEPVRSAPTRSRVGPRRRSIRG